MGEDRGGGGVAGRAPGKRRRFRLLRWLAWFVAAGTGGALLFAHLWPPELTETGRGYVLVSHAAFLVLVFGFHIGLGLAVVALFAAAARMGRLLIVLAPVLLVTLGPAAWSVLPRFSDPAARAAPGGQAGANADALTVMSVNLMYSRADLGALAAEIAGADPDVIVFQEYSSRDRARLAPLLGERYPHRVAVERDDAFGQAVYSRRAFLRPPRNYPPGTLWRDPQITVCVDLAGAPVFITNIHLLPPISLGTVTEQRLQAAALADLVRTSIDAGETVILAGDFNATPGSHHLRAMERAGVRESHALAGRGRGSTWPRTGVLAHLPGIRLDNIFISPDLACVAAWTGGDIGSDHRPVVARVVRRR